MSNYKNPDLTPELGQLIREHFARALAETAKPLILTPQQIATGAFDGDDYVSTRLIPHPYDVEYEEGARWLVGKPLEVIEQALIECGQLGYDKGMDAGVAWSRGELPMEVVRQAEGAACVIVTTNCLWCYRPEDNHIDDCPYGPEATE